jgi:hypothetical protein
MKTFIIDIDHPGEPDAGFDGYTEEVSVSVLYDAGGEMGEFEDYMRECVEDWFDGAKVKLRRMA